MRFLTTIKRAGKAEYFAIALLLNAMLAYVTLVRFKLEVFLTERTVAYDLAEAPLMAFVFAGYAALIIINSMRRIKQLPMKSNTIAYLAPVPIIGHLIQLFLSVAVSDDRSAITPYGKNPYDPNSWVPPSKSSGASSSAVALRGETLSLPGEEHWDEAA